MQLQEQGESIDQGGGIVLWLVWLLPPVALALLLAYVLSAAAGIDVRAAAILVITGHGGEVFLSIVTLIAWLAGHAGQLLLANWPLALVGGCLAGLLWVLRFI